MMMKLAALVFIFCVSVIPISYSQTKEKSIAELFHLMKKDSVIDRAIATKLPSIINMVKMMKDSTMKESDKKILISKLQPLKELTEQLQKEEMALYDKYFSEKEINDLIAIYKSPSGSKLIELTPKIQSEMMLITQQKYMKDMMKIMSSMKESSVK